MKFSIKSFAIGFGCAALSIGAVTYASAASDATLKACANKTTGAMRYIAKGSCKKTETSLLWSQMGPQGLPGATGPTGVAGTNGQNFHVIDATGRDLGIALSSSATTANIMFEGGIWQLSNTGYNQYQIQGDFYPSGSYIDSSCVTPYWGAPGGFSGLLQSARGAMTVSGTTKYFKPTGTPFLGSTMKFYGRRGLLVDGVRACIEITNSVDDWSVLEFATTYFTDVVEVTPPAFTAPFTIVAK